MIKRIFYVFGWLTFGPWLLITFFLAPVTYILTGKSWDDTAEGYMDLMKAAE